jgi:hypothetical protein
MGAAEVTSYPSASAAPSSASPTGAKASPSAAASSGLAVFTPSAAAPRNYGGFLVAVAVAAVALFEM